MRFLLIVSSFLLPATPAAAGNLWIVDPALGPGATHATIGAAVLAAADGDQVLVRAGTYLEHVLVDGKALSITAEQGAGVQLRSLEFRNLSGAESAVVSGLEMAQLSHLSAAFTARDCAGPVWVQDCEMRWVESTLAPPIAAHVLNSAAVTFQRCELRASTGLFAAALHAENSSVFLFDTLARGADGVDHVTLVLTPTSPGTPGVRVLGGSLYAQGCEFRGGEGGSSFPFFGTTCLAASNGGAGLRLEGGDPQVVLLDTLLAGGAGGTSPAPCSSGVPGPEFTVTSGTLSTLPGSARSLSVAQPVREGETAVLTFEGVPGDLAWMLVSAGHFPHAPWFGTGVLLVAEPFQIVFAGALGAGGQKLVPVTLGELGLTYVPVFLQGVFFHPAENFPHSSGVHALLLDAAVL